MVAAAALCSCGGNEAVQEAAAEKSVMTVSVDSCMVPYTFPAQIRGRQDISIYPQVNGILKAVLVLEGQTVRKGQVMFLIDDTPYAAAADHASAAVEMAKANVETAQLELDATKTLFDRGVISEHQYKVHTNNLMMAKANLDEAKAALKKADNDLSYTRVRAPHDGVVGNIPYRQGSLVGPTLPEPLTIVSDNSSIYAYMSINADAYLELAQQLGGKEKLLKALPEMELILGGEPYGYKGKVETVSGIIDEQTGALSVRVLFPNPDGILTAGGSGTVRMYVAYDGIRIPRSATYELQDKHFVYKAVASDTACVAKSAAVSVLRLNETEYIVVDGLAEGDRIVLDGVKKMSDNMKITPKEK